MTTFDGKSACIGDPQNQREGVLTHSVQSPFQAGETSIHVILPDAAPSDRGFRTLFILPVEPLDGQVWGDALGELLRNDIHNSHQLVCVMPTFSHMPWYADHPTDPEIRQESHFVQAVLPFIERTYPVDGVPTSRLLLGFSKSGWGAFSLLLRNPQLFGKAAAWDAPLGQATPTKFGMREVFPDQESLDPYSVWDLIAERAADLKDTPRLALVGHSTFRGHHQAAHTTC